MAPANTFASTVTIERGYFETLVRRAQFNSSDIPLSQSTPNDAVTVSRADLEALQEVAKQYENLRRNLLRGGVAAETIALLSKDDTSIQDGKPPPEPKVASPREKRAGTDRPKVPAPESPQSPKSPKLPHTDVNRRSFVRNGNGFSVQRGNAVVRQTDVDWAEADPALEENSCSADTPADDANGNAYPDHAAPTAGGGAGGGRPHYERQCTRTLLLANLPDGCTHADIASVVRGGLVLDIFLRSNDRSASVSFLNAADARTFYEHARRYDLYIRNKRVDVRWSDRHFILPGHVASKIIGGATRNLVVRRCDPKITEEGIREDLEHIHNLVVVKIEFLGGSCFISTNSVHNAMFARTCMMSRFKYKGSKIDWDVDECTQPLERIQPPTKPRREPPPPKKQPVKSTANRFGLLNIDGDEDDEDGGAEFSRVKEAVGIVA